MECVFFMGKQNLLHSQHQVLVKSTVISVLGERAEECKHGNAIKTSVFDECHYQKSREA